MLRKDFFFFLFLLLLLLLLLPLFPLRMCFKDTFSLIVHEHVHVHEMNFNLLYKFFISVCFTLKELRLLSMRKCKK